MRYHCCDNSCDYFDVYFDLPSGEVRCWLHHRLMIDYYCSWNYSDCCSNDGPLVGIDVLLITLIFAFYVRKRIRFTARHLQVSCTILRAHPLLILVAIAVRVMQILWLICSFLIVIGTWYLCFPSTADPQPISMEITTRSPYYTNHRELSSYFTKKPGKDESNPLFNFASLVVYFLILILAYWGINTFFNLGHFINVCTVGRW